MPAMQAGNEPRAQAAGAAPHSMPSRRLIEEIGAEAVVADEHDGAEVDRAASAGLHPPCRAVEQGIGHPLEADAVALDLGRQAVAEHDDRGGCVTRGCLADRGEEFVGHARDRLARCVPLEDGGRAP